MGSSFGSYQIAKSGMYVSERGLDVVGHNIANTTTLGFTRQQSIAKTSFYQGVSSNMQSGTGASIEQTRQIRSTFLDNIYRQENQLLGQSEAKNTTYTEIQNILSDPMNDGFQTIMNNFWDSWQELSKDPSSLTVRALVRQRGQALSDFANNVGRQLTRLQSDLNNEIVTDVNEINDITSQIAALNVEIPAYESCGDKANDLRDQRNVLLDRLTKLVDVDVTERQNGSVDVTLDGNFLVTKDKTQNIALEVKNDTNIGIYYDLKIKETNTPISFINTKGEYKSGSISGLMESCKEIVPAIRSRLNTMIQGMADKVNTIQRSGKTISDQSTGQNFFVTNDGKVTGTTVATTDITLDNICINSNLSDLNKIISSQKGEKGDNTLALSTANLRNNADNPTLGKVSIDEYYQSIIQDLGSDAEQVKTFTESQSGLVDAAQGQRDSLSGVSMDEELTRMLKYQFAYGGASRVFNAIDEMLKTVVGSMGLVGR